MVYVSESNEHWFCRHLGCHVDGFVAVVAHTHVLSEGPVTGRAADVLAAAHTAAEVALRLVRPGKKVGDWSFVSHVVEQMSGGDWSFWVKLCWYLLKPCEQTC